MNVPTERELLLDALLTDHGAAGPYEAFRRLRETRPVLVTRSGVLVLSRYDDCAAALRDRRLGKADESLGFGLSEIPDELQRRAMHRFRRTMLFRNPLTITGCVDWWPTCSPLDTLTSCAAASSHRSITYLTSWRYRSSSTSSPIWRSRCL